MSAKTCVPSHRGVTGHDRLWTCVPDVPILTSLSDWACSNHACGWAQANSPRRGEVGEVGEVSHFGPASLENRRKWSAQTGRPWGQGKNALISKVASYRAASAAAEATAEESHHWLPFPHISCIKNRFPAIICRSYLRHIGHHVKFCRTEERPSKFVAAENLYEISLNLLIFSVLTLRVLEDLVWTGWPIPQIVYVAWNRVFTHAGWHQNVWRQRENFDAWVSNLTWHPMQSIKKTVLSVSEVASKFWRHVVRVKTLKGSTNKTCPHHEQNAYLPTELVWTGSCHQVCGSFISHVGTLTRPFAL